MADLSVLCIDPDKKIRDAMQYIDRNCKGIVLVCMNRKLLGTVTDGDIRRAILLGTDLDATVETILEHKRERSSVGPVTAPVGTDHATLVRLMAEHSVRQIPLLDDQGRVEDLLTADDLLPEEILPMRSGSHGGGIWHAVAPLDRARAEANAPRGRSTAIGANHRPSA